MIHLTLKPAALTSKGQRYEAWWGEGLVCTSRQPFYDAARFLLAQGVNPAEVLEASHAGNETVAIRSTVGAAAQFSVGEGELSGLSRRYWQPYGSPRPDGPTCMALPKAVSSSHVCPDFGVEDEAA